LLLAAEGVFWHLITPAYAPGLKFSTWSSQITLQTHRWIAPQWLTFVYTLPFSTNTILHFF